jgi:hypothetical protein
MTTEPDRIVPPPGTRMVFLDTLEPLPLVDPTQAARFLGLKRHTLACYRNLGGGPAYYKFGRWIRYAWADLRQWAGFDGADVAWAQPDIVQPGARGTLLLVDTTTAARFLTLTRFCLANYRAKGGGPHFCRFGRRIHYPVDELLGWAWRQRRPQVRPAFELAITRSKASVGNP